MKFTTGLFNSLSVMSQPDSPQLTVGQRCTVRNPAGMYSGRHQIPQAANPNPKSVHLQHFLYIYNRLGGKQLKVLKILTVEYSILATQLRYTLRVDLVLNLIYMHGMEYSDIYPPWRPIYIRHSVGTTLYTDKNKINHKTTKNEYNKQNSKAQYYQNTVLLEYNTTPTACCPVDPVV